MTSDGGFIVTKALEFLMKVFMGIWLDEYSLDFIPWM